MQARISNPAVSIPDALGALQDVGKVLTKAARASGIPTTTLDLVYLRASQINGCAVCLEMHAGDLKKEGATDQQLFTVAAWREAPYFSAAERAALALTEAATRLSDRPEAVSDEIWDEAAKHYDESALATLVLAIANINLWNRLNATTRQVAGQW
jgi:AhpD family alkylhydroperoxidase